MLVFRKISGLAFPKGPCTQIVDTQAPKYLHRDDFKPTVYTIWAHGPLGIRGCEFSVLGGSGDLVSR